MFDPIVDILERKAKEGVQVRLIYDDVGCIQTLPPKFYQVLQAKGIHCACFNPFRPVLSIIMNNRDHRKILVVDGKIALLIRADLISRMNISMRRLSSDIGRMPEFG